MISNAADRKIFKACIYDSFRLMQCSQTESSVTKTWKYKIKISLQQLESKMCIWFSVQLNTWIWERDKKKPSTEMQNSSILSFKLLEVILSLENLIGIGLRWWNKLHENRRTQPQPYNNVSHKHISNINYMKKTLKIYHWKITEKKKVNSFPLSLLFFSIEYSRYNLCICYGRLHKSATFTSESHIVSRNV